MTERLYYADSLLLDFDAQVVGHGEWDGHHSVILNRTAFYPESGGQLGDRGSLGGLEILDVQADANGQIHHLVAGELPEVGTQLSGEIEATRRRQHMALHTGQHMLSRALLDVANAPTVSSRLGEHNCTVDVSVEELSEEKAWEACSLVNEVISEDRAIRAYVPDPAVLASLPLRRDPKVENEIRVVDVDGFDMSPCGGTHCLSTAQVGLVYVRSVERNKGGARVNFSAGQRARLETSLDGHRLKALSDRFSCGPEGVKDAIENMQSALKEANARANQMQKLYAASYVERLLQTCGETARLVASIPGADPALLKQLSQQVVAKRSDAVVLLAGVVDGNRNVLIARGENSDFDCGRIMKILGEQNNGRGGGRPELAQGRIPTGGSWDDLVQAALEALA
ncbi:MAG: alanyl-tRNA editing protein [Myxococcales bacterium]|nr:alanyl-tRNA editing protein [Myxococcales bacterium]